MSREANDALEAAQTQAQASDERLELVLARHAGLELQRQRLAARLSTLERKRNAVRAKLDALPGNGLFTLAGFCLAAVVARLVWEARPQLEPDLRVLLGVVALATSLVTFVSRTHWFRFGLGR